jgi:TPP-dependent pyruvate/acetoin dehydrogenase alpha subunit
MDVGVRRKDELKDWIPKDPIARARRLLQERGEAGECLESLVHESVKEVEAAIEFARNSPFPPASGVTDHVFVGREKDANA